MYQLPKLAIVLLRFLKNSTQRPKLLNLILVYKERFLTSLTTHIHTI